MIVIPMAGMSKRFAQAGYDRPKYMLEAHGKSLFNHTVSSFKAYFDREDFLFIYREVDGSDEFVRSECRAMGIKAPHFVDLGKVKTLGQADTVRIGLEVAQVNQDQSLTIFNIDTIRPNFTYPSIVNMPDTDGYLEVFKATGDGWSFVAPGDNLSVERTTEKDRISDLCSTGLYYFKTRTLFERAFAAGKEKMVKGEIYVAPLYNELIQAGKKIRYHLIEQTDILLSGVPEEYERFMETPYGY